MSLKSPSFFSRSSRLVLRFRPLISTATLDRRKDHMESLPRDCLPGGHAASASGRSDRTPLSGPGRKTLLEPAATMSPTMIRDQSSLDMHVATASAKLYQAPSCPPPTSSPLTQPARKRQRTDGQAPSLTLLPPLSERGGLAGHPTSSMHVPADSTSTLHPGHSRPPLQSSSKSGKRRTSRRPLPPLCALPPVSVGRQPAGGSQASTSAPKQQQQQQQQQDPAARGMVVGLLNPGESGFYL
jgi:hypothetical protein